MPTPAPDSLDARIALAEAQLIARERAIGQRWATLQAGGRRAWHPRRLLTPLLGASLAGLAAWGLRRAVARLGLVGARGAPTAPGAPTARTAPPLLSRPGGLAWSEIVLLAWPLLPARWRSRVSPATATAALDVGLPLMREWFGGNTPGLPPPATVVGVDLARYAGEWHEQALLPTTPTPDTAGPATLTWTPQAQGDAFDLLHRRALASGGERVVRGVAHAVPGSGNAQFKISFFPAWLRWLPTAWADCAVLYLDTAYSIALLGTPDRRGLRVLSRAPRLPEVDLQALLALAREEGYPTEAYSRSRL